jgi:hypothetical protein
MPGEREDLIEQIDFLHWRKAILTFKAGQVEDTDPELADHYDAEWNKASNEVGQLLTRLYEIEARISRREKIADAAYGRP